MISSKRKSKRSRRQQRASQPQALVSAIVRAENISNPQPPQFQSSVHFVQTFRFVLTSSVIQYQINPSDICALLGVCLTLTGGTGTASQLITRFKYKRIEMWTTASSLSVPSTLVLTMADINGNASNTEQTQTDTTAAIDRYAYVKLSPKVTSPGGQWQNDASTTGSFVVTAPIGAILDLTIHAYLNNDDGVNNIAFNSDNTVIGVGSLFLNFLDSNATTSGYFQPVGYLNPGVTATPTPRPTLDDLDKKLLVAKAKVPPDNKAVALLEEEISALRLSKRFNA